MLTLEKKGGKKKAMFPKAKLGVIVGIEDNMPAYRVYDFEQRGVIRKIPFAQVVTHEGHYPFKDWANWSEEEKDLPESFIPSLDARNDIGEWRRFGFSRIEEEELGYGVSTPPADPVDPPADPADPPVNPADPPVNPLVDPIVSEKPPALEPLSPGKVPRKAVDTVPPRGVSDKEAPSVSTSSDGGVEKKTYSLRAKRRVDYVPPPQTYRKPLKPLAPSPSVEEPLPSVLEPQVEEKADVVDPQGDTDSDVDPEEPPRRHLLTMSAGNGEDSEEEVSSYCSQVLDPIDCVLPSLMVYRANAGPLPNVTERVDVKVDPLNPLTKPVMDLPATARRPFSRSGGLAIMQQRKSRWRVTRRMARGSSDLAPTFLRVRLSFAIDGRTMTSCQLGVRRSSDSRQG